MMRTAAVSIALVLSLVAKGETLKVTDLDIDSVWITGSGELEISQGEKTELLLRGDQDDLDKVPYYTRGNTLVLGASREHKKASFSGVKFKLTVPRLEEARVSGSGDMYIQPLEVDRIRILVEGLGDVKVFSLKADQAALRVAGSGDIQAAELSVSVLEMVVSGSGDIAVGELRTDVVETTISGSGDIRVKKSLERAGIVEINIAGGGEVNMSDLALDSAEINIIGSGDARVGEVEFLEVNIIGSGDIYYGGDPEIDSNVLGSGDLNRHR